MVVLAHLGLRERLQTGKDTPHALICRRRARLARKVQSLKRTQLLQLEMLFPRQRLATSDGKSMNTS